MMPYPSINRVFRIHAHTRNQLHSPLKKKVSFVGTSCSKDVFSTAAANPAAKKTTVGGGGAHHSKCCRIETLHM